MTIFTIVETMDMLLVRQPQTSMLVMELVSELFYSNITIVRVNYNFVILHYVRPYA